MFDPPRVGRRLALMVSALAISLVALFSVAPQSAWAADDDIASGDCGTCVWTIDANGKLTIAPEDGKSGRLPEFYYSTDNIPWYPHRADIKAVTVSSGVRAGEYCIGLFRGCSKLIAADLSGLNVSSAVYADSMFYGCQRLKTIDLSDLSLSRVKSASCMFMNCTALASVDLGNEGFSALSDAGSMFRGCSSLDSVNMPFLLGSNLEDMSGMFRGCSSFSTVDLSGLSLPKATRADYMFSECSGLKTVDLSGAKFPRLDQMSYMFEGCSSLNSANLSDLYVHGAGSLEGVFSGDKSLNTVHLDGLDCDAASSVSCMFQNCSSLVEADFSNVKASSIQDSWRMFGGCSGLKTVDLSGIDSLLSSCSDMFDGCKNLTTIYDDGGFSVLSDDEVFYDCVNLRGGNGTAYNDSKTASQYARIDKSGQPGYFTCKHSEVNKFNDVAASSGKEGSIAHYECSVCEKSFEDASAKKELKSEDLVLHAWGDWASNDDATCTKDGTKTRTCAVCGKSEKVTEEGSKTGHKPGDAKVEQGKKPTCTEEGSYHEVRYCEICGVKVSDEAKTKPALGHDPATKTSTKPASLGSDGYVETSEVCKRCGEVLASGRLPIPYAKSVSLASASLTYSGKANRPSAKVVDAAGNTLRAGVDYSVSYADDGKAVGTHKVTVKGEGDYSFTKELSFVVNPKGTSLTKLSKAKKALTAKWKKTSDVSGYQLRYSAKSNMKSAKTATVKSAKTTSKKVTKLKKKTKYYVQVRTYKVVKGKTYYSSWSKAKSVKTK